MYSVTQDMEIRFSETDDLISLIAGIESGTIDSSNRINMNTPVLRASVVLSLYNTVESTITNVLTKIHDEIVSKKVNYNNLSKEIRDIALVYFYKHKEKRADIHSSLEVLHSTVDLIRGKGYFDIKYKDMIESYQLYSGNLDARIIRKIMRKYGIVVSEDLGNKLVAVKNGRNKLAHGELSFEEFGRNVVLNSLREYLIDVKSFLEEVINGTSIFLENQKYKKQRERRKSNNRKRR